MPLPKLELKPGVTESCVGGPVYEDFRTLFRDLHAGVLELGVGHCEVIAHDEPRRTPPRMGFDLCQEKDAAYRVWSFMIAIDDYRKSSEALEPALREALTYTRGRCRVGRMLEIGMSPQDIHKRLSDPTAVYVQQKIKRLQERASKAQADAQEERENPPRRTLFDRNPATEHFLLQQRISALEELVEELYLGKHLPKNA